MENSKRRVRFYRLRNGLRIAAAIASGSAMAVALFGTLLVYLGLLQEGKRQRKAARGDSK